MTRAIATKWIFATPIVTLLAACGGDTSENAEVAPVGDAPPEIAERHDNFEAISDSFKLIRTELEGGAPDFAAMETAAADINTRLQRVPELFPEGTSVEAGYDTEALATIWEKPEEFAAASEAAITESEAMMAAVATGDAAVVGEQVGKLGVQGCKNCHDSFRLDDD